MSARALLLLALPFALLAGGCATTEPPELVKAKSAYEAAARGPAAMLNPSDLRTAHAQLALAQRSFDKDGPNEATVDLAYAAERKAQLAEVRARILADRADAARAKRELGQMGALQARLTSADPGADGGARGCTVEIAARPTDGGTTSASPPTP